MTSYKTREADASLSRCAGHSSMVVLSCPQCSTRFQLPAKVLGGQGRKVRCAKCGHSWHQKPVAEDTPPAPAPLAPPPRAPAPPPPSSPPPVPETMVPPPHGPLFAPGAAPVHPPGMLIHFDRQAQWLLLICTVLAGLALLVFEREAMVGLWPAAARLYEAIGLPVDLPGAGLEFQNVQSYQRLENSRETLFVEGRVANLTQEIRPVPQIAVTALDVEGRILRRWLVPSSHARLAPGEIATFQSMEPSPGMVRDVAVTFFHPGWEARLATESGHPAPDAGHSGDHPAPAEPTRGGDAHGHPAPGGAANHGAGSHTAPAGH